MNPGLRVSTKYGIRNFKVMQVTQRLRLGHDLPRISKAVAVDPRTINKIKADMVASGGVKPMPKPRRRRRTRSRKPRYDVPPVVHGVKVAQETLQKAQELRARGWSFAKIGRALGCSTTAPQRWLNGPAKARVAPVQTHVPSVTRSSVNFCPNCGHNVSKFGQPIKFCPACGFCLQKAL